MQRWKKLNKFQSDLDGVRKVIYGQTFYVLLMGRHSMSYYFMIVYKCTRITHFDVVISSCSFVNFLP